MLSLPLLLCESILPIREDLQRGCAGSDRGVSTWLMTMLTCLRRSPRNATSASRARKISEIQGSHRSLDRG
jgi:hypothetical protein